MCCGGGNPFLGLRQSDIMACTQAKMLLVAAPCLLQIQMSKGHSGADPGSLCQAEVGCILRGCENEEV